MYPNGILPTKNETSSFKSSVTSNYAALKIFKGIYSKDEEKCPLSPTLCLLEVLELTKEVFSLKKNTMLNQDYKKM